jgi:arylsulfatase A-like enzyme
MVLVCVPGFAMAAPRTNVVLILIDDLGRNDLGCYGSRYFKTPNLDRLAQTGVRFTHAYAACPVCSPTRAAILTGKYPARLHLTDWLPGRPDRPDQRLLRPLIRQELPLEEVTLAETLKAAGYATGHVGKWHLGGDGFGPRQQGFDVNIAGDQAGSPRSYFAPFRDKQGRFMPGLEVASEGEYLTDRLTTEAERFIDQNRDRPFFLYLAHYAVHTPLRAQPELVAHFKAGGPVGTQNNPVYAAMIESMDASVGRLMKKLADLHLDDHTLIVFTSDNGGLCVQEGPNTPATINAPLREGKGYLYEGGVRVPLLMRRPGDALATTCDVPVCSVDLNPTILQICNVSNGTRPDGVSVLPALEGKPFEREALYWHYPHYSNQGGRPGGAVRVGDLKLIEFYEQNRRELYDVRNDVGESRNLAGEKTDDVTRLATMLESWRQSVNAQRMRPNPKFVPNPQANDGTITLPARTAEIHGLQLRYEPLPHKDTLGYWTRLEDWATWDFQVNRPGKYVVELLQGCGAGQGGSEVEITIGEQKLGMRVDDTGGWQAFKKRTVGQVSLERPGITTVTIRPKSKAGVAVMDLRSIVLRPDSGSP